jgi:hypothetical protein
MWDKGRARDREAHKTKSHRVRMGRRKLILYGAKLLPSLQVRGEFIYICVLMKFNSSKQEFLIEINRSWISINRVKSSQCKRVGTRQWESRENRVAHYDDLKARGNKLAISKRCQAYQTRSYYLSKLSPHLHTHALLNNT